MGQLDEAVHAALARLRLSGTDLAWVEAKRAAGGLPRSLAETLSAFANGQGGLIILGLDEGTRFAPVETDVKALGDALARVCADDVVPPLRAEIDVVVVDGIPLVAARVAELPVEQKPCYVRAQGLERGSYLRTHDGDRHLTTYEVHVLLSSRGQPKDDAVAVPGTSLDDLDRERVAALIARLRRTRGPVFERVGDETILRMVGVLARDDAQGGGSVTLAGLLALGIYPQQHFPQLNATLVVYPTVDGNPLPDGTRFLDNLVVDGPIPLQVEAAVAALRRNMSRRSLVIGLGREDRWDYPSTAIREVVVNALMHRDYHPLAHGAQVRLELYPDRLVVTSPGGLHGPVAPDDLLAETVSSSRNAVLAKLLEDVELPGVPHTVCENRGTGLLTVAAALRDAGMQPPTVTTTVRTFSIEMSNHTLLDQQTLGWLTQIDTPGLNDRQRHGLAYAKHNGALTNSRYRSVTGCDAHTATRELSALATAGLIVRESAGRATTWHLSSAAAAATPDPLVQLVGDRPAGMRTPSRRQREITELLARGALSTSDLAVHLGITSQAVLKHLNALEAAGIIVPTASNRRSPRNAWALTSRSASPHEGTAHP